MASYRLRIGFSVSYALTANSGSLALTGQSVNLSVASSGATVSWSAPVSGPTPTEYVVYRGKIESGTYELGPVYVGNVLSVSIASIVPLTGTYYCVVRAVTAAGESNASNEFVIINGVKQ